MGSLPDISVVIPTLNREKPLVGLLRALLETEADSALEILVMDQSDHHEPDTQAYLELILGRVRYFKLSVKSLTKSRNEGVRRARGEVVLFMDDDVIPEPGFVNAHRSMYQDPDVVGVTGPVLDSNRKLRKWSELSEAEREAAQSQRQAFFDVDQMYDASWAVGCNSSFRKSWIEKVGYYDENFYGVAVGEDAEFSHRIRKAGGRIRYNPSAMLIHSPAETGGCRNERHPGQALREFIHNAAYFWNRIDLPRRHQMKTGFQISLNALRDRRLRQSCGVLGALLYVVRAFNEAQLRNRTLHWPADGKV